MQTSKTSKIALEKNLLERVLENVFSINQSCAYFMIDENRISSTKLSLHFFALLNSCNCREKIDDCSKHCELV